MKKTAVDEHGIHASTGYWVKRLASSMGQVLHSKLSDHGITGGQWAVLATLDRGDASTPREIARSLGLDPSALTRLTDGLEEMGLLVRRPNPADRRSLTLELTDKGKAIVPKIAACSAETNKTFLAGVTQRDAATLLRIMKKMLDNAEDPLKAL